MDPSSRRALLGENSLMASDGALDGPKTIHQFVGIHVARAFVMASDSS